ncbi:hypothetical protein [Aquimarina algiphila]|uniref:Uncharacterized protein n=1 Tax=Aquimarina algiphila TaxID=2047982 RepID=A0A554VB66_9FLAO|nr:hypothetical protein [Aquimarina algiphila]TSE03687.1 hypothetical protein FOF46_28730 [Aquimarina algiphila]
MKDLQKDIATILSEDQNNIAFQDFVHEQDSPLNEPVIEREGHHQQKPEEQEEGESTSTKADQDFSEFNFDDGIPEQEINEDYTETTIEDAEEFEIPTNQAKTAADTILGVANNVLGVGAGFFIKIHKHKEFYEFDEVIQVIEEQNEKNINLFKLDKEDKALLRPLLIQVLKAKAKKLTVEQQLIGAIVSILIKKAQVMMEIRAENEILEQRILAIVKDEQETEENEVYTQAKSDPVVDNEPEEEITQKPAATPNATIIPNGIIEVAEEVAA